MSDVAYLGVYDWETYFEGGDVGGGGSEGGMQWIGPYTVTTADLSSDGVNFPVHTLEAGKAVHLAYGQIIESWDDMGGAPSLGAALDVGGLGQGVVESVGQFASLADPPYNPDDQSTYALSSSTNFHVAPRDLSLSVVFNAGGGSGQSPTGIFKVWFLISTMPGLPT